MYSTYTRCDQKITVIFKFRESRMLDFRIFLCVIFVISVIYMLVYVDNISHSGFSVCF